MLVVPASLRTNLISYIRTRSSLAGLYTRLVGNLLERGSTQVADNTYLGPHTGHSVLSLNDKNAGPT